MVQKNILHLESISTSKIIEDFDTNTATKTLEYIICYVVFSKRQVLVYCISAYDFDIRYYKMLSRQNYKFRTLYFLLTNFTVFRICFKQNKKGQEKLPGQKIYF